MTQSKIPAQAGIFPLCFQSLAQFRAWWKAAEDSRMILGGEGDGSRWPYCEDCTSGYQWEMLLARRCENPKASPGEE